MLQRPGPADLPYTTLGRLGPSCQSKPHNSLSKLLFFPDCTIVMLSWRAFPHVLSSFCNWSRMQQPEWSLMSRKKLTLFIRLHWLPIAARIKFKVLMFAYKTTTGTEPIYLNLLVQTYAPSRSLRSASERRLVVPSQRGTKSLSRTFFLDCAQLMEWPPDLNSNSWVFSHFQKTSKRHIFFASTWPTNTNTYLFYLKKILATCTVLD